VSYRRTWRDGKNATGFAAACARLALPAYKGVERLVLVTAIEFAEACVRGEKVDPRAARTAAANAVSAAAIERARDNLIQTPSNSAANAAYYAAAAAACYAAADDAIDATDDAADAAYYAEKTGINVMRVYATWIARDLGLDLAPAQLDAAVAALVAGDEAMLAEIAS
jgi:hypothetical protein